MQHIDGRRFAPELTLRARRTDEGTIELYAPAPGLHRNAPREGVLVTPGGTLGELEVLGVLHRLRVPNDAFGVVMAHSQERRLGRRPVDAGTVLVVLDPTAASGEHAMSATASARAAASGPVFKIPLGGRYYARPSPGADAFVKAGDVVRAGTTVALIEVMKTFNRVSFGGPGVPERARVKRVVPSDGDDLEAGDVLLELEADDG